MSGMKRVAAILVGVLAALGLAAAPAQATNQVTYILRSNTPQVENIYVVRGDGGTWNTGAGRMRQQDSSGEWWWRSYQTVSGEDFFPLIIAQTGSNDRRAYITCEIWWNGQQIERTTSRGAYAVATC